MRKLGRQKKLLSILLTAAMTFAMGIPSNASEAQNNQDEISIITETTEAEQQGEAVYEDALTESWTEELLQITEEETLTAQETVESIETEESLLPKESESETEESLTAEEQTVETTLEEVGTDTAGEITETETEIEIETEIIIETEAQTEIETETEAETEAELPFANGDGGSLSNTIKWTYSRGTLEITGSGAIPDYERGQSPFYGYSEILEVYISEKITSIGSNLFQDCDELESCSFPSTLKKICANAFEGTNLYKVIIPSGVTEIGSKAFMDCKNLSMVSIPASVEVVEWCTFSGCSNLTEVSLAEGLKYIDSGAFINCSSLSSIKLPSSTYGIGDFAFENCTSLKEITIPKKVTSIERVAFGGCTALEYVYIKGTLSDISYCVFTNCTSMKALVFSGDQFSVSGIDENAFSGLTTTACYPAGNNTWKTSALKSYGGSITWKCWSQKLPAVQNLKASSQTNGCKISWTAVAGAEGYAVYGKRYNGSYGYIGLSKGNANTSYLDTKASEKGWNFYWVYAYNTDLDGKMKIHTPANPDYVYGRKIIKLPAVTNLKASSSTQGVTLTWTAVSGASGYMICGTRYGESYASLGNTTKTTYTDKLASAEGYNFYWVIPFYKDFNGKIWPGNAAKYVYGKKVKTTVSAMYVTAVKCPNGINVSSAVCPSNNYYYIADWYVWTYNVAGHPQGPFLIVNLKAKDGSQFVWGETKVYLNGKDVTSYTSDYSSIKTTDSITLQILLEKF